LPVKLTKEQIQNGFLPPGNEAGAISGLGNAMRVRRTPRKGKPVRESKGEGAVRDAASPGDGQSANREVILNAFPKRGERARIDAAWLAEVRQRDATFPWGNDAAQRVEKVIERLLNKARRKS
jgi:hypothetical protein